MSNESNPDRLLSGVEACAYLDAKHNVKETPIGLACKAVRGGGPIFMKWGRLRKYTPRLLDQYVVEKLSPPVRSTSELREHRAA